MIQDRVLILVSLLLAPEQLRAGQGKETRVEFPTKSRHRVNGYSACSYSAGETYPSEE